MTALQQLINIHRVGEHACPGRFFASNEIKIALGILLLEYEFEYVPGDDPPKDIKHEIVRLSDPSARVRIRRREEQSIPV